MSMTWRVADIGCGDGVDLFLSRKRLRELNLGIALGFAHVDGNHDSLSPNPKINQTARGLVTRS